MPIRPSAAAELRQLIDALGGADDVAREAAVARLTVVGARAADHLLREFATANDAARAAMLRVLEPLADPRVLPIARGALQGGTALHAAAIAALRPFLTSPAPSTARDALDSLVAVVLDTERPLPLRQAAFEALGDLPPEVREPLRAALRGQEGRDGGDREVEDEGTAWREALEGRFSASPEVLRQAVAARRGSARLTELQRLVDRLRAHEQRQTDSGGREQWRAVRGAVHQALAARNSRLALYDLRDSLLDAERLPVAFLAALEDIGDASCLETLAGAYEASSRSGDTWWREHVATAFRAIVHREGLTRRHAAVKRALQRWPEATADLMARS